MKRDKTKLTNALKEAKATVWQSKAAFILFKVNDVENALKYVKQIKRRNKQMTNKKELYEMDYPDFRIAVIEDFEEGYGKSATEGYEEFKQNNPGKAKEISMDMFLNVTEDDYKDTILMAMRQGKPIPDSILKEHPEFAKDKPELMKIRINRKTLSKALANMKSIVSGRHTLAILSSILISAKEDNTVEIIATDLEMGFKGVYPAKVATPGDIAISHKELSSFVSKLKSDEISIAEKKKDM